MALKAWNEQHRPGVPKKRPEIINQLKKKHRRTKLSNTVTIDSIYEKKFLSLHSALEAVIFDVFVLPGTYFIIFHLHYNCVCDRFCNILNYRNLNCLLNESNHIWF